MTPWRAIARAECNGKGSLEELMPERIPRIIETIVEQELAEVLGAASWVGEQRARYRKR
jgi:hypothetical protein